jgi:hypothetical protein
MKTKSTHNLFLISFVSAGLLLFNTSILAQQPDKQSGGKKTITIHVTKEDNGGTTTIDTTIITEGDFDADAFLKDKGVMDEFPENGRQIRKNIIMRHPDVQHFGGNNFEVNTPDTIMIDKDTVIIINENFDMPTPPPFPDMPFRPEFKNQQGFSPMGRPRPDQMMEGFARALGLEDFMPFGDLEKIIVKKKHHGKKVIISFEDRDEACGERDHRRNREEREIIYNNEDQGMVPQNEERVIVKGEPGRKIIINKNIETNGDEKTITIKADVDNAPTEKQVKKVIIIKEEKTK